MRHREIYVNVHSELFPDGEVRAQLLAESQAYLLTSLAASQEVPPVDSRASGTILFEKNGRELRATGSFAGLSSQVDIDIAGGAHIHIGKAGQNGPVEALLQINFEDSRMAGQFLINENQIELFDSLLIERDYYVNIHTENQPDGELRGQLTDVNLASFVANLDGMNEVPFIKSGAQGQVLLEFNGQSLVLTGSFDNLSSEVDADIAGGVHIHEAPVGENGPVALGLAPSLSMVRTDGVFERINNTLEFSTEQLIALYSGELYINIHTREFLDGELRGQLLPIINFFPSDGASIISPENGEEIVIEGDPSDLLSISWSTAEDRDQLAYLWELALDEEFERTVAKLNVGMSTFLELDFSTIDHLLGENDVMPGEEVTLYHRAIATDGSLMTPAPSSIVRLVRGTITSTNEQDLTDMNLSVRPNLVSSAAEARVIIENDRQERADLIVIDINGQVMNSQTVQLVNGVTDLPLNLNNLRPGIYFVQWLKPNGQSRLTKFIVSH